ncbi:MAG: hypothetical protein V7776_03050 [Halopseudomonas aestusnigri]
MKTSISVTSSPYLTRPLRSIEQVQADQEEKKHRLETEKTIHSKRSAPNLNEISH